MMITTFYLPTKIIVGPGSLARLGAEAAELGRKAILISGKSSLRKIVGIHIIRIKLCCRLKSSIHIGMFRADNNFVMPFFDDCSKIEKDLNDRHFSQQKSMIRRENLE